MPDTKKPTPPKNTPHPEKQIPGNVVPLSAAKCCGEGCKEKPSRAGFCESHYEWFKEGLITLEGYKARDFDKKYHAFMRRKAA